MALDLDRRGVASSGARGVARGALRDDGGFAELEKRASLQRASARRLAGERRAPHAQVPFARDEAADVPLDRHRGELYVQKPASLDGASSDRLRRRRGGAQGNKRSSRVVTRDARAEETLALYDGRSQVLVIEPVAETLERRSYFGRRAVLAAFRLERAARHRSSTPSLRRRDGAALFQIRATRQGAARARLRDERREAAVQSLLAREHAARARRDARRRAHSHTQRAARHAAATHSLRHQNGARARRRVAPTKSAAKRSLNRRRRARPALGGPAQGEVLRDLEARASPPEPRVLHDARRGVLGLASQKRAPELQEESDTELFARPARVEKLVARVKRERRESDRFRPAQYIDGAFRERKVGRDGFVCRGSRSPLINRFRFRIDIRIEPNDLAEVHQLGRVGVDHGAQRDAVGEASGKVGNLDAERRGDGARPPEQSQLAPPDDV